MRGCCRHSSDRGRRPCTVPDRGPSSAGRTGTAPTRRRTRSPAIGTRRERTDSNWNRSVSGRDRDFRTSRSGARVGQVWLLTWFAFFPVCSCSNNVFIQVSSNLNFGDFAIEILGAIRSMFEKRDYFFLLISTLFCEVERGFVDRWKMVSLK
jgi:hypothetical protein